jgi:hypothetical protein
MLFFIWHSLTFHIWKYALDPEGSTPKHHHQQWKTSPNNTDHHSYSFLIYSLFYSYFSPRKAYISIFGNAYWTLKAVPDVATNSKHHPYFFLFFLLFFCYFSFVKACISIFGNAPWTLKAVPQQYHQQGHHPHFFPHFVQLFYYYFSFVKVYISFFRNAP